MHALRYTIFLGGNSERVTPLPIPNREVKPFYADGTARETRWESRSLPGDYLKTAYIILYMPFFLGTNSLWENIYKYAS